MFVANGYENVSMRKIAEKIEYSPTTIYRIFKNKADIMIRLIAEGYLGIYEAYQQVLLQKSDSPWQTLNKIIHAYVTFALEHPNHFELWFATGEIRVIEGELHMHHGDLHYKAYGSWLEQIEKCKALGMFAGKETLDLFQLLWSMVIGTISLRIRHPEFPWIALEEQIDEMLRLFNRGLGVEQDENPGS